MVIGDLMQHERNFTMLASPVLGTSWRTCWDNMKELGLGLGLTHHPSLFMATISQAGVQSFFTWNKETKTRGCLDQHSVWYSPSGPVRFLHYQQSRRLITQQPTTCLWCCRLHTEALLPCLCLHHLPFNGSAFSPFLRDSHQLSESVSIFNDSTFPLFHVLWWGGGQVGSTWQPVSWQLCVWKAGCCLWSRFQWMNLWIRVWDQNDSKRGVPGEKEKDAASRASFSESARRIMEMEILGRRVTAFH